MTRIVQFLLSGLAFYCFTLFPEDVDPVAVSKPALQVFKHSDLLERDMGRVVFSEIATQT